MLGSLIQVRADIVFQDNFGSGNLNKWTVMGSPPNIVQTPRLPGTTYSIQFPLESSQYANNLTYIQAPFPKSTTATLEFFFQTDTAPPSESGTTLAMIMTNTSTATGELWLLLSTGLNGTSFTFTYPTSKNGESGTVIPTNLMTGWYKFDIAIDLKDNPGSVQLSINNSPVFNTTVSQANFSPTVFRLGPYITNGYSGGNIYFGDVAVANTLTTSIQTNPNSTSSSAPEYPTATLIALVFAIAVTSSVVIVIMRHKTRYLWQ